MEKKKIYDRVYVCTIYGSLSLDEFINIASIKVVNIKHEILRKYPNVNELNVKIEYDDEYREYTIFITYYRTETDKEYNTRMKTSKLANSSDINRMKFMIKENPTEAIEYLKSIGAI